MTDELNPRLHDSELVRENQALMNHIIGLQQEIFELQVKLNNTSDEFGKSKSFDVRFASPIFIIKAMWDRKFKKQK